MHKWKVQSAPTGQWRSFEKRGWPEAFYGNGDLAASLQCQDEYVPSRVKTGRHLPLTLIVADYSGEHRRLRKAKETYATLDAAKGALSRLLKKNPGILPQDLR